jgi:RNA-dependent RNA polymerase
MVDFFLKNMASDNMGRISNAHVVHADISEKTRSASIWPS